MFVVDFLGKLIYYISFLKKATLGDLLAHYTGQSNGLFIFSYVLVICAPVHFHTTCKMSSCTWTRFRIKGLFNSFLLVMKDLTYKFVLLSADLYSCW